MGDWKFKNIPRIAHFYWGNGIGMSYLNFLSIFSFKKLNPDWKIILWTTKSPELSIGGWGDPEKHTKSISSRWPQSFTQGHKEQGVAYTGKNFFKKACELATEVKYATPIMSEKLHPVHNADLTRIQALKNIGGLWSDFDVLHLRPINDIKIWDANIDIAFTSSSVSFKNNGDYHTGDPVASTIFCISNHFSIGLMLSKPQSPFFSKLLQQIVASGVNLEKYQSIGVELMHEHRSELLKLNYYNIPMDHFYPIYHTHLHLLYSQKTKLPKDNIGIHWYNGNDSSGEYRNRLTESNINQLPSSTITEAIKKIL